MKKIINPCKEFHNGDVIAFSGKGRVSNIIKAFTSSDISHVGLVINHYKMLLLCESTTLIDMPDAIHKDVIKGVQMQVLLSRIENYHGQVYHYPLKEFLHPQQITALKDWCFSVHRKRIKYDTKQAIFAGIDTLDNLGITENEPDFSKLFCSELVCKALQEAGKIDKSINASEMTPQDVCSLDIFEKRVQLK